MEITDFPLQLIPLLPLVGALVNLAVGKRLGRAEAGAIGSVAVGGAMFFAWWAAYRLFTADSPSAVLVARFFDGDWIYATDGKASIHLAAGLMADHLAVVMIVTVTTVGFLIHVYSTAYMEHDPGLARYFGYLNLFTGAMLILVLGDSLPVTFVGWEGVGVCSYLLIGFWFDKEANAFAGRKAFIVNRIGDFGFLLGMFLIFSVTSTLSYRELALPENLNAMTRPWLLPQATFATFAALLLFVGATGKSAQLPLYVWLPDAMAGPTPVSALIHAATMVTAGVYMVARMSFLIGADPFACGAIALIGALTALFAASIGVAQRPIKKILAYSTVSQLGFMFIGVGTKAYSAGVFHLFTHAFFKAGLFLGAGSIMHALGGEEDVTKMGGLRRKLPITHATYLIYCLAIAGIFPFAGFFSKDAILTGAFVFDFPDNPAWPHGLGRVIYGIGLAAAALTSFYMFRSYFLVFHGRFRGDHHQLEHAHESPPAMTVPLVALAIGAIFLGFLGVPEVMRGDSNLFEHWLVPANFAPAMTTLAHSTEWLMMGAATLISLGGIGLAYRRYGQGLPADAVDVAEQPPFAWRLLANKYYVDELYDWVVVRPLRWIANVCWKVFDALIIDLVLVRGSAMVVDVTGRILRYVQNGDVQRYVVGVVVGTAGIVAVSAHWVAWRAAHFEVDLSGSEVTVRARGIPQGGTPRELKYFFDFGDGTAESGPTGPIARHRYSGGGKRTIQVRVVDQRWQTSSRESRTVVVTP